MLFKSWDLSGLLEGIPYYIFLFTVWTIFNLTCVKSLPKTRNYFRLSIPFPASIVVFCHKSVIVNLWSFLAQLLNCILLITGVILYLFKSGSELCLYLNFVYTRLPFLFALFLVLDVFVYDIKH